MYRQFNIQQFYILTTHYLCVLCGSEDSHYFPTQHKLTGFYNRDLTL